METLPLELVDLVCSFANGTSLKQLRLLSRRHRSQAEYHLFRSLVIWKTVEDWGNLDNICRTPHLACLVERIRLAHIPNLPEYPNHQGWKRAVAPYVNDERLYDKSYYHAYRAWYKSESRMDSFLADHQSLPEIKLELLKPDTRVETVGVYELTDLYYPKAGRHYVSWNRRSSKTLTCQELAWHFLQAPIMTNNSHLELFMLASKQRNASFDSLSLHAVTEILIRSTYLLGGVFRQLQHLVVDLGACDFFHWQRIIDRRQRIAPWVEKLPNLRTFTLFQADPSGPRSDGEGCNVLKALRDVEWPILQEIHLHTLRTTEKTLLAFLKKFSKTLKVVGIVNPVIRPSAWQRIQHELCNDDCGFESIRLEECELTDVYEGEDVDSTFLCSMGGDEGGLKVVREQRGQAWIDVIEKWHDEAVRVRPEDDQEEM